MSHLERDILKGKFGRNPQLKKEAREEMAEEKIEKKTGKHVKIREIAGRMKAMFNPRNTKFAVGKEFGLSIRQARRFSKGKNFTFNK